MSILHFLKRSGSNIPLLLIILPLLFFGFSQKSAGQCNEIQAYASNMTTGNQAWTGQMAMQFTVSHHVEITQLGVFDDATNEGISGSLSVGIIDDTGTSTLVGPVTITGTMGFLSGRYRMVQLVTPVVLPPGTYHIVSVGFSGADPNGNAGLGGGSPTILSTAPVISYGGNRSNTTTTWTGTLPGTIDGGPTGRYHAGTFNFNVVTPQISSSVLGVPISNPGLLLLTRQICNNNNNVTATNIIQTNISDHAFIHINITESNNINTAAGGPAGDMQRLNNLPLDGEISSIGTTWMNFIDDIRLNTGNQWGFVEITLTPYTDIDGSDDITPDDCLGTPIVLRFEVQPIPQVNTTFINPDAQDGEICSGETIDVDLGTNNFQLIGGTPPSPADYEFVIVQIRYSTDGGATYPNANSGYPAGLTGGTYAAGDIISSGVAQISEALVNTTLTPAYLRYQVIARLTGSPFCEDNPMNIRIVINPNPTASILPDPAAVCAGANLELNGNPSGGSGTFTSHEWAGPGILSLSTTNTQTTIFNNNIPNTYDLVYTVSDDNGCTGSDVITVTVHENPTANITPEPAEACILIDILLNGNPAGGTMPYIHLWSGAGSPYLSNTGIVNPVFNHNQLGPYEVTYTVTDDNGCIGSDVLSINLTDNDEPVINCPVSPFIMETDPDRCDAIVSYPITTSDDCPFYYPPTLADHEYIGTFGGSTYFRSVNAMSWDAANNAAASLGGHLVNITSAGEQNYLSSEIPDGPFSIFWIGLRYSTASASYAWTSGATVTYTNWALGEPSLPGVNDFVYLDETNTSGTGWYNTPDDEDQRYIIEFSGLPKKLISGLPIGSVFPLGETEITYETEDSAGNTSECTFTVTVIDEQDPVITCPDDVTINLEPLECEGLAYYEATAKDNCSVASIDYSIPSGSFFPIGINPVTVKATDDSGNTDECTFNVWVYDYINPNLACKPVNLSLDEVCSTSLDPTIFLTGWQTAVTGEVLIGCPDNFNIIFLNKNNNVVPVEQLKHHIGKTLQFKVSHTMQSFTCWNDVLIEDKYPPTIDCRDLEVHCLSETDNLVVAFASDNCSAEPKLVDAVHKVIDCDEKYIGSITKKYVAIDKFGNQSKDTCTATIYLLRSNFGGILAPADKKLQCSDNFKKDNKGYGNTDPSVTGVPTFDGKPVYPTSALQMSFCNATIDYDDVVVFDTPCKKRIRRTWKIFEWHCSNLEVFIIGMPQMIDIVDDTAPVIPPYGNQNYTTSTKKCSASVTLPALAITDNCNTIKSVNINVTNNGVPVGALLTNGGIMEMPVGINIVDYQAIDLCGNVSTSRFTVTVNDDTNPIALCDQYTTVSLNTNGYTEVTAKAVDDGSFDECGPVTIQIQRMEDPCGTDYHIGWHDVVSFCCSDANASRMVTVLVTDAGGNTNMCMVQVNVQEKVIPTITCPDDRYGEDCTFTFDPANLDFYFGEALVFDNCPANNQIIQDYEDLRNDCGVGKLVRTFEVRYNGITYGSCSQTITFINDDPFDGYDTDDLVWPANYTTVNECEILMLEPEMLPDVNGFPKVTRDVCDRVGFTKHDKVYPFTSNGACLKILRTWTVIDWCQVDQAGKYKTWTYAQEIKVMDNETPVITSPDTTRTVLSYDADCKGGQIVLTASATDCTPQNELSWKYKIYDADGQLYKSGYGNDASGFFPYGDYSIDFTVEDRCGNLAVTGYTFEIISAKSATPICFKGLSSDLVVMDTDNDNVPDTAMVEIHVNKFNNWSYHSCYPGSKLIFSYSPDVNDTLRVFGCADLGLQPITMYVTDINGNQAFCRTDILITNTDPAYQCPNLILEGAIAGRIATENNQPVEDVVVTLGGTEIGAKATDNQGKYVFPALPLGGNYNVSPEKDDDDTNGVSTLDVVLIQRHILGIEKLNSLYKYVAADINNDNKINSVDLVELRKVILGTWMKFPNNTSWRFLEKDFQFLDPNNPLALFIPGNCAIINMQQNMQADFIAVKTGDVNESAKTGQFSRDITESRHHAAFTADDDRVKAGEVVSVAVRMNSHVTLYGWQQFIRFVNVELLNVSAGKISQLQESMVWSGDHAGFSVAIGEGNVINAGEILFTLTFKAYKDGKVSDFITFDHETLQAELYADSVHQPKSLKWTWIDVSDEVFAIVKHQPNPWKESTTVGFTIPRADMVSVKVKDQTGRTVYSATNYYPAGEQSVEITREIIQTSGLYFVEIKYNQEVKTIKTIMID